MAGAVLDRALDRLALGALQITRDGDLLLVLTAAKEEDIDVVGDRIADADLDHPRRRSRAMRRALLQRDHVAAVAIDVHLGRVEPADREGHAHRYCSQNRSTAPRSARLARRSSMAV